MMGLSSCSRYINFNEWNREPFWGGNGKRWESGWKSRQVDDVISSGVGYRNSKSKMGARILFLISVETLNSFKSCQLCCIQFHCSTIWKQEKQTNIEHKVNVDFYFWLTSLYWNWKLGIIINLFVHELRAPILSHEYLRHHVVKLSSFDLIFFKFKIIVTEMIDKLERSYSDCIFSIFLIVYSF